MYRHENIYQIVLSKRSSKTKAKLIKKEMMEMVVDKINTEGMTLKEKLKKINSRKERRKRKKVFIKRIIWMAFVINITVL